MLPNALKVRPAVAGAVFAIAAFGVCAVADRVEARLRIRAPHAATLKPGDTVRYELDRLSYDVVDVVDTTALIRRGAIEVYAHRAEITRLR